MSGVSSDATQPQPQREGIHRPPLRLRGARVKEGDKGDWSVFVWTRSEAEALDLAKLIDWRLGRKSEREAGAVEP